MQKTNVGCIKDAEDPFFSLAIDLLASNDAKYALFNIAGQKVF